VLFLVLTLSVVAPPPITEADLEKRCAAFSSPDSKARLEAAKWIASQPPESMEVLAKRLAIPRQTAPDLFRRIFLEMWAQVPNWKGYDPMWIKKPEPPWTAPPRVKGQPRVKRPPPHDPETLDWIKALDEIDLGAPALLDPKSIDEWAAPPAPAKPVRKKPPPVVAVPPELALPPPAPPTREQLEKARAEAMEVVALMRGIAASKRMDAVDPIFKIAFDYEGSFRDECGRQIRSMESFAVPALIRLMHQHGPAALHLGKQRRYASYQLDRMDRARPQKAIAAAPDDRVKAAIIHQYGEEHALEAVEAILGQVDAPSHRVRKEARWAWLRYVTGKPPPPAPKRKRKLPGGREEEEEKPDYLTYREIALLALQKQVQAINGEPPDPKASPKQLTDELFEYYDRNHAAEWDAQFEAAKEKESAGDLAAATDGYSWILAHDPNYGKRGEMAHAFAKRADELRAAGKRADAVAVYRQAADLAPDGPEAPYAAARAALLDGELALARGRADVTSFRRALALDPSLKDARTGLARAESVSGRKHWLEFGEALVAALALAFGLWALWRKSAPPKLEDPVAH
jgi:tetratricopeptide (TPR) repeat protein